MKVGDFFQHRKRWWLRLHEKGGKRHEVPCHEVLQEYLNEWIRAAGIGWHKQTPLFRSMHKGDQVTDNAMGRFNVLHIDQASFDDGSAGKYGKGSALSAAVVGG
jgi:integrase